MAAVYNPATHLIIKGARQHNLKNINLFLPKNRLIVFTGLSGSGKSSLAFDTIYAEGQRRYVESLSPYARQFLGIMQKPDVDQIEGLSPAISIDQKTTSHNPRSTVGTITEIYDYLRLLFARIGHPHCPDCHEEIVTQSLDQITQNVLSRLQILSAQNPVVRALLLAPLIQDKKGEFAGLFQNLLKKGYDRVRVDGRYYDLNSDLVLIKTNRHTIDVVLDRLSIDLKTFNLDTSFAELQNRLNQSIRQGLELTDGSLTLTLVHDTGFTFPENPTDTEDISYSQKLVCPKCHRSFPELEPRLFSFNTPHGACPACTGLGSLLKIDPHRIIAPDISISEGAIIPLASALSYDSWYARKVKAILDAKHASISTPFSQLDPTIQKEILWGSQTHYEVKGTNKQGNYAQFSFQWEGIIHELERRYQETHSDYIRSDFEKYMTKEICPLCHGARLKPDALSVTIQNKNLNDLVNLSIKQINAFFMSLLAEIDQKTDSTFTQAEITIASPIVKEISSRLNFLIAVGLDYLTLHREAATLAGGEAQRIRLASQIGTGLTGVLYVLDEPTIGLHPRDNERLITTLKKLRDLGNTVIVVEHDRAVMKAADLIVDFGPGAGRLGGHIVAQGTFNQIINHSSSLTSQYLKKTKKINARSIALAVKKLPPVLKPPPDNQPSFPGHLTLTGARIHNLKNLSVKFPLSQFIAITGVSGSGKSSLIHDTLYPLIKAALGLKTDSLPPELNLEGATKINRVNLIDQSPIGRTPRSNPATYTKAFDLIRNLFSQTKEAKIKGFKPGQFSFNLKGGRCEACQGEGQVKIEMQFLSDVYITCEACHGTRYSADTLQVEYKNHNIAEILDLTVDESVPLFQPHTPLLKKLSTLQAVGLGYIKLGQPAPLLSGGEAQRVKLAKELSVISQAHTVYILDEPTTGLHFEDVKKLLIVLKQLVLSNNTVIVIEHNSDVIKNADYIIDLGPEGGELGGEIVATGTPQEIQTANTYTGRFLAQEI